MQIRWFRHGQWPKWLVGLHHYTIASFILLAVTGVALYMPAVHTPLIPYLPLIYKIHILLGLVFTVTLITPFLKLLPKGRRIWRLDWTLPVLVGTPLVLTGIMLWGVTWFPTTARSHAFTWHGILTVIFGAWILIHAFYKALGIRPNADGFAGRVDMDRRRFVRAMGTGVVGTVLISVIDPMAFIRAWTTSSGGTTGTATAGDRGVQSFPAYYTVTSGYPTMSLTEFRLQVTGSVGIPRTFTFTDLKSLPAVHEVKDFHCVTGWSVPNVSWKGVHLSQLVALVKPTSDVSYVNFYSFDGKYTETLKLSEALDPSVLLVYEMDGQPLRQEQGYPLRLFVPKMYGYKSIKWVNRVEFSSQPIQGYWEKYGYPVEAYF